MAERVGRLIVSVLLVVTILFWAVALMEVFGVG